MATALIALLIGVASAFAQETVASTAATFPASKLYAACTHAAKDATPQEVDAMEQTCVTYFRGLTDAISIMRAMKKHYAIACLPKDKRIDIAEARADFEGWLKIHPAATTSSAGLIAAISIMTTYQCKK